jgi:2-aminoadipate transaminase
VAQLAQDATRFDRYLSSRGRRAADATITDPQASAGYISFIYGFPDSDSLPAASVLESTRTVLTNDPEWSLQYGSSVGVTVVLDAIREKLARDQGMVVSRDQLMMTAGSSQGIQLLVQLLVDPGDVIVAESPTFLGFFDDVENAGATIAGVPVTDEGIDVAALERTLADLDTAGTRARFIYTLPNFQNPTGVTATEATRRRVAELAREYDTLIVEDDAYFDLRYDGEALPTIYSLDQDERTFYLGTLSKTLAAGFRLGWLAGPPPMIRRLASLKTDGGTNIFGSYIAAEWLPTEFEQHVDQLREIYGRRRDLMLAALERHMPEGVSWTRPDGGFFIWATLPEGLDTSAMLAQARELGIEYLPGTICYFDDEGRSQMRLSFSYARDEQIEPGIEILAGLVSAEMREARISG